MGSWLAARWVSVNGQSCTVAWWTRRRCTASRRYCWRRWFTTHARSAAVCSRSTWWRRSTSHRSTALWEPSWCAPGKPTATTSWRSPSSTTSWLPAGCRSVATRSTFRWHYPALSCRRHQRVPCDSRCVRLAIARLPADASYMSRICQLQVIFIQHWLLLLWITQWAKK